MTNSVKNIKAGTIIVLSDLLQSNKILDVFVQSTYPGLTTMGLFQPKFKSFTRTNLSCFTPCISDEAKAGQVRLK